VPSYVEFSKALTIGFFIGRRSSKALGSAVGRQPLLLFFVVSSFVDRKKIVLKNNCYLTVDILKKFAPELNVPAREEETLLMAQIFKIIKNKYFTYQKPCSPRSKIFPRRKELAQHHDHPTMAALFAAPVRLEFVSSHIPTLQILF